MTGPEITAPTPRAQFSAPSSPNEISIDISILEKQFIDKSSFTEYASGAC
jgi:hypothetical protein